jgi:hypothetical protein
MEYRKIGKLAIKSIGMLMLSLQLISAQVRTPVRDRVSPQSYGWYIPLSGNGPSNPITGEVFGNTDYSISIPPFVSGAETMLSGLNIQDSTGNIIATGSYVGGAGDPPAGVPTILIYSPNDGSVILADGWGDYVAINTGEAFLGNSSGDYVDTYKGVTTIKSGSGATLKVSGANNFEVSQLSVYVDNAAAVAGGLKVGTLYRTGGDPDVVCIVH